MKTISAKRVVHLTIVAGALMLQAAHGLAADLAKQGNFTVSYTSIQIGTNSLDPGDGKSPYTREWSIVATNDAGSGLFHNMSAKCFGVGVAGGITGYCLYVDKDGDKFLEPIYREPGASKGTATLTGGTGKFKGIEGSLEFQIATLFPAVSQGQFNHTGRKTGSYKLP
jgi:hypothetical protein